MSGKCSRTSTLGISVGGVIITSQGYIARTILSSFSSICRSDCCDPSSGVLENYPETLPLYCSSQVSEAYNAPFNMDELLVALEGCCNTSTGPDGINNQMLTRHPLTGKEFLLSMYNCAFV
jgi:hypothetical protein